VRRARWGDEALGGEAVALRDERGDPEAVLRRRETLRRLVSDLADLPVRQRTALLARELDGQSAEQVAEQLGVSVPAAQMLATRARENLVKTRAPRDADCAGVRAQLLDAHERGVRPSEHALRHTAGCDACQAYRRDLRRLSARLQALHPVAGLPLLAGLMKVVSGGGGKTAAAAAAALAIAATGGVLVLGTNVVQSGDPAPFVLKGVKPLTGRAVSTGQALPPGTALVTARVRIPAGAPRAEGRSVTVACPDGMKVAGLQAPEQRFPMSYGLAKGTIIGYSTRARIDFGRGILPREYDVTVGALCRRADAAGSITDDPRETKPGEQAGRICDASAYVYRSPGRVFVGTVFKGQPVSILRRPDSGTWARVVSDIGMKGWVKVSALCG
jgi:hypothetical protein